MAKVKVFVHTTDFDAQADSRAMTLAPQTYLSWLAKNQGVFVKHYVPGGNKVQKAILSFNVTRSLTLVSFTRASLVEYACQIRIFIPYSSKVIANVKVYNRQTNRQTDKQTGQKQYAPDHSINIH